MCVSYGPGWVGLEPSSAVAVQMIYARIMVRDTSLLVLKGDHQGCDEAIHFKLTFLLESSKNIDRHLLRHSAHQHSSSSGLLQAIRFHAN